MYRDLVSDRRLLQEKVGWFTLLMPWERPSLWWEDQDHIEYLIYRRILKDLENDG